MPSLTLAHDNHAEILAAIRARRWTVACLCAAWCGTCGSYRAAFDELAQRHPDKTFVWIDIEDHADLLGDLDIENFPTLLVQHGATVDFCGTVLPDAGVADRMIQSIAGQADEELARLAGSSDERRAWQRDCNLLVWLGQAQGQ
jgi:thiol-disulfide isomerase/thioredoxin